MAAGIIGAIAAAPELLKGITDLVDRFVPDPAQKAQAALDLQKLVTDREVAALQAAADVAKAQSATNATEAQSSEVFVSGWRPFVGWVCGGGCAYSFIAQPLLAWVTGIFGTAIGVSFPVPPIPDANVLFGLLTGMLGVAGLRTFEKTKGVGAETGK